MEGPPTGQSGGVFVFFSNRLGCLGSAALSIAGTALLLLLLYSCTAAGPLPIG